jgi:UDP-glucose 4-epimerase
MKVVITGALGHIGTRLLQMLPVDLPQAEFLLVDHLQTRRYNSLFDLPAPAFELHAADVLTAPLERLFDGATVVIHLATATDAQSRAAGRSRVALDAELTERVARACAVTGAPLLFPSTTSVYASPSEVVDETCPDVAGQTPYAEAKLASERLLEAIAGETGLEFVICRFGSIFGVSPGMRFHTAVNKFLWQACFGQPLTVWRTALHQRRPYLAVDDCARVVSFVLSKRIFHGTVYNAATSTFAVSEIIDAIRQHAPTLQVELEDNEAMNELSYGVSCKRLESLGFVFCGSLERAVADTFRLLRNEGALIRREAAGQLG